MENEKQAGKPKRFGRRLFRRIILVVVIALLGLFAFFYWGIYERGVMAGKVLRISERGIIFKTYEGKISLESFGSLKGTSPIAEVYDFSVGKKDLELIKQIENAALTGERVSLHYIKRYRSFPWRGSTKVFVVSLERQLE